MPLIKFSLFLLLFILIYILLNYLILTIWIKITCNHEKTNELNKFISNQNELNSSIVNCCKLIEECVIVDNGKSIQKICDNLKSERKSKFEATVLDQCIKLTNQVILVKKQHIIYDHGTKIKLSVDSSAITFSSEDNLSPTWSFIGFILLNLCLTLNCFWIRSRSIHHHIRISLAFFLDINLTYVSLLIAVFQLFPCIQTMQFLPQILEKNFEKQAQNIQNLISNQPFAIESFVFAFCITGTILALLRRKYCQGIFDEDFCRVPHLFRCLSRLFYFLNVVLFRKTRRYRRRNVVGPSSVNAELNDSNLLSNDEITELMEEEILSGDDEDEDGQLEDFDFDPNEDIDRMLIERLFAVPNLWLHTELISNDYIEKLPIWNYQESKMIVDCNQNLMMMNITESSCQSSSSDEDNYLDSKEQDYCQLGSSHQYSCIEPIDENILKKDNKNCIESNQSLQSSSKERLLESVMPEIIHNRLTSSIKRKMEKKRSNLIRKSNKSLVSCEDQIVDASCPKPYWMMDLHECTVCLEPYENNQLIMGLACGHSYHQRCIGQWLTRGNHCCPICRWPSYRLRHPRQQLNKI